jgi:hypothetical protein
MEVRIYLTPAYEALEYGKQNALWIVTAIEQCLVSRIRWGNASSIRQTDIGLGRLTLQDLKHLLGLGMIGKE